MKYVDERRLTPLTRGQRARIILWLVLISGLMGARLADVLGGDWTGAWLLPVEAFCALIFAVRLWANGSIRQ